MQAEIPTGLDMSNEQLVWASTFLLGNIMDLLLFAVCRSVYGK